MKKKSGIDILEICTYEDFLNSLKNLKYIILKDESILKVRIMYDHFSDYPLYMINDLNAEILNYNEKKFYYLLCEDDTLVKVTISIYKGKNKKERRYIEINCNNGEKNYRIHPERFLKSMGYLLTN